MGNPFLNLFKDKQFNKFNSDIDKLILTLGQTSFNTDQTIDGKNDEEYSKLITNLISDNSPSNNLQTLLQSITVPEERLARYNIYDEIYKSVPIIKRIFKVYISNIIQKNPVDGRSIIIRNKFIDKNKQITFLSKKFIEKSLDYFDLIKKYKFIILPRKMLYGDCYVEVINTDYIDISYITNPKQNGKNKEKDSSLSAATPLMEQTILHNKVKKVQKTAEILNENNLTSSFSNIINDITNVLFEIELNPKNLSSPDDIISLFETEDQDIMNTKSLKEEYREYLKAFYEEERLDPDENIDDELGSEDKSQSDIELLKNLNFNNILLKIHKPHNIIVLETQYGVRLGYLEIAPTTKMNPNDSLSINNIVGKLTNLGKRTELSHDDIISSLSKSLIQRVFKLYLDKNKKNKKSNVKENENYIDKEDKVKNIDPTQIFNMLDTGSINLIKQLIIGQNLINDKTKKGTLQPYKVRFIPTTNMVAFSNPSLDYYPYSESIVESLILPSKLYILSQLCNHIIKFSRASLIRKWTIEQGSAQGSSQLVQKLKRELLSTKTSLNDLSTFKNTNKILSDFKDMVTLTKGGQKTVDVEVSSLGDPSVRVQDLEDSRKEIIALSGIPATYLGQMEAIELRDQLVHINIAFASDIIDMQDNDNSGLNKIIDIIAKESGLSFTPSKCNEIALIPPVALLLQLIEMLMASTGNIIGSFTNIGVDFDPYFLLENYIPHMDWNRFKKAADHKKNKQSVTDAIEGIKNGGSGGSGGGGFGG